ncbi:MAG: hypothetical protein EH225_10620 [Calditrichaeota bacterium]|nr:SpoIIE family protein phosphatase [Calditrichota bacterium]RQW00076.1 MAG: hypothetical protein EH225_10620 [Calditrichota bacterium]
MKIFHLKMILHLSVWILFFIILLLSVNKGFLSIVIPLVVIGVTTGKIVKEILSKISPPSEIPILFLLVFMLLERLWFSWLMNTDLTGGYPRVMAFIPQICLLIFITFTLSFLLIENNKGRSRTIYLYMFLAFLSLLLLKLSDHHFWMIFQIILLFVFFRQTSWAEKLTKIECIIYFTIIGIIALNYQKIPYLAIRDITVLSFGWYFLPKILSHFVWIYLLAVLLKIPFVLVYHHAGLSRKFKIAGWLQSSIPQFIQLVILVLVFYFFIGGWQAENLKNAIITQVDKIATSNIRTPHTSYQLRIDEYPFEIKLSEYETININRSPYKNAVIPLRQQDSQKRDYFLLTQLTTAELDVAQLVKIDSSFLKLIHSELQTVAASGLVSYPFRVSEWDSILYNLQWWISRSDYQEIRIFPFALTPYESEEALAVRFPGYGAAAENETRFTIMHSDIFTAGRVFIPMINYRAEKTGLWAFDIVIIPTFSFFGSPLIRQILFWLIAYLLINLLVIQRVIKFGNQINEMIVQKFDQLTLGIRQISGGNLNYKIDMEGEDEFVELAERFNQMSIELQQKMDEAREKDRLEHELRIARDVQLNLLPANLPEIEGYSLSSHIRTATEVGGDFYDVLPLKSGKYLFVIGDVSGKGTSAAFYMAQCISLIRFAREFSSDLRDIMLRLNNYFSDPMIDRQIFVTAIIGILEIERNSISFIRAGHNLPIYLPFKNKSDIKELKSQGLGLGLERSGTLFQKTMKIKTIKFNKGDTLFLYTDGLVEASSYEDSAKHPEQKTEFFGEDRLLDILKKLHGKNPDEIIAEVNREIWKFYGTSPLIDDMTMLVIQRSGEE